MPFLVGPPAIIMPYGAQFAGAFVGGRRRRRRRSGIAISHLIPIPIRPQIIKPQSRRSEFPQRRLDAREDGLEHGDDGAGDAGTGVCRVLDARDDEVVPVEDAEQIGGVAVGVDDGAQGGLVDDEPLTTTADAAVLFDRQGHDGAVVGLEFDLGAVDDAAGKVEAWCSLVQPLVGLELGEALGESRVEHVVARLVAVDEDLVVALAAPLAGAVDVPELLHDGLGHGLLDLSPRLRVRRPRQIRHVASDALDALGLDQAAAFAFQQSRDVGQVRA